MKPGATTRPCVGFVRAVAGGKRVRCATCSGALTSACESVDLSAAARNGAVSDSTSLFVLTSGYDWLARRRDGSRAAVAWWVRCSNGDMSVCRSLASRGSALGNCELARIFIRSFANSAKCPWGNFCRYKTNSFRSLLAIIDCQKTVSASAPGLGVLFGSGGRLAAAVPAGT